MKKSIKKALVGVSAVSHMAVAVGAQMSNLELAKLDSVTSMRFCTSTES